jgi:hypothetical protein
MFLISDIYVHCRCIKTVAASETLELGERKGQ